MASRGNWFVIFGYALVGAATQLLWLTYAPITTNAATYYDTSEEAIGTLSIIFPLIYVVLAIPFGIWLDRWFRPMLILGAILTAVGGLIRILGEASYDTALIGQIVVAIGQPLVLSAITALCVQYLPPHHRAKGIAIGSASLFAGMLIAFVSGALLENQIHTLLVIQGVFGLLGAIVLCLGLTKRGDFGDVLEPGALHDQTQEQRHPLRAVWADPIIRLLVLIVAVGFGVFVTLTTWLQALLEPAGVTTEGASIMLLIMVVAGIIGAGTLPPIATKARNQPFWLLVAIVVSTAGCLVLAFAPGLTTGIIVSAFLGLLLLATLPIVLEMVEARTGAAASTATALIWLAGNAGGVILSVVVGFVIGSPTIGFIIPALVAIIIGLPFVLQLRKKVAQEEAPAEF